MIRDKIGCINGCMVKSNLVIFLVPYPEPKIELYIQGPGVKISKGGVT